MDPSPHDLDKRIAILEHALERLSDDLKGINQNLSRLVWAVSMVFVAGIGQFVLKGGLNV